MTTIKKYIPVMLTLLLGLVVLTSQVFFKSKDINASPSKKQNKLNLHYENSFKEVSFLQNGVKKELINEKARIVILNFWASWCVPCLEEFPALVKFKDKYKDEDVLVVGVNTDEPESYKDAKKIIQKFKINFPIVFDEKNELISKFKVSAIPISIIFEKGKVIEVSNGAKDFMAEEFLEQVNKIIK